MNKELDIVRANDLVFKIRQPDGVGPFPAILMLHGWTGDEDSMWVFANQFPVNYFVVAPRAPHVSTRGGYSWVEKIDSEWPQFDDFTPSVERLMKALDELSRQYEVDFTRLSLVGFSQGAALSFALAMRDPDRIERTAGLAGFLPEGCEDRMEGGELAGIPFFLAHGKADEIVPISMAYAAKSFLEKMGGRVLFCESEAGHRLGANCFKALNAFMRD